ncbi:hypothetical protein E2C01_062328 [Portunus trituberculatus]|uniref:Uncharacterized protein n=1 Tax=Portunus trituberculatus TaxID=210409 RepID=A0A5B7HDC1_PORTR|nr:hypothetical protein [Portunus trituberculatus]
MSAMPDHFVRLNRLCCGKTSVSRAAPQAAKTAHLTHYFSRSHHTRSRLPTITRGKLCKWPDIVTAEGRGVA